MGRPFKDGGAEGIRTPDPHNAIVVLYQLSYDPIQWAAICERGRRLSKFFIVKFAASGHIWLRETRSHYENFFRFVARAFNRDRRRR